MRSHVLMTILLLFISFNKESDATLVQVIRDLIQYNLAGIPFVHEVMDLDFDPDISIKRREQYWELHGYKGEKLIERLGLGYDGKHKERKIQQQIRDEGHLGGLNYYTP